MTAKGSDLVAREVIEHKGQRILPGQDIPDDLDGTADLKENGAIVTRKAYLEAQENAPDLADRRFIIADDAKGNDQAGG